MKHLFGFGLSILFVILWIYLVKTNHSIYKIVTGFACILFFGGFMIWAIFKKLKNK